MAETQDTPGTETAPCAERAGLCVLRGGLAVVFVWFGALKFFPGASPAEGLVDATVSWAVDASWFVPVLGAWECAIGVGLLFGVLRPLTFALLFIHMAGTFMPFFVCPQVVWTEFPLQWTLEGQYIVKNVVLIGAGMVLATRPRTS